MNKLVTLLTIAAGTLLLSCTHVKTNALVVTGQIERLGDSLVITDNLNPLGSEMRIATPEGKINFTYSLENPTMLQLSSPETTPDDMYISFEIVGVPGETAELSGVANGSLYVTGSKFYKEFDEAVRYIEEAGKERIEWMVALISAWTMARTLRV